MSQLDEIFDKVIVIKEALKLPKNSCINTYKKASNHLKTCPSIGIIVYLTKPSDYKNNYKVIDATDIGKSSCIIIQGLKDSNSHEVSSWLSKTESRQTTRKNSDIQVEVV